MSTIFVYTDGGARGNPGEAALGVVIKSEKGQILKKVSRRIGQTTNNVAEYQGVVAGLEWVRDNIINTNTTNNPIIQYVNNPIKIYFFLDSKLVVNQINGLFKMKEEKLRIFLVTIRQLEQEIGIPITYTFIPREQNREADALVNQALDHS